MCIHKCVMVDCEKAATYRVDYRGNSSEYFCDDHVLLSGVDEIKGIHKLEYNSCEKLVM